MRIGIFGSAFDPFTNAHGFTAYSIAERRKLDKVIFVPSADLRTDKELQAGNEHRWQMLLLGIEHGPLNQAGQPLFEASRIELDATAGSHYTLHTMNQFKEQYPEDELFFIMGADLLPNLHEWRYGDELVAKHRFIVMARGGYDMLEIIARNPLLRRYEMNFDLLHKGLAIEISSTYIREELKMGASLPRYLMPRVVEDYILEHKLYQATT
ncbi:nicotinate (nicotinamide) nucleotide adenylyltransferase [Paenibacillus sp. 1001270B_150601_E10]|uniref:nicotinate (nicotinamide) nucleotide adenylyltransferase n=1 Tax=Paenibacillus sp. 1001270B_150601_E10 TaxID=2787079 RepID=UPI00189C8C4A|nr:nicotinate (nicotinamide) nucleotide adenylyltransferase [Paenibacillus sp. 1001270B_150601_E10]